MSEFIPPPGAIVSTAEEQVDFIPPKGAIVSVEEPPAAEEITTVEDTELASGSTEFDYSRLIKDKKGAFDQGEFKMAEREAYEAYKKTGEIDISLIPKETFFYSIVM